MGSRFGHARAALFASLIAAVLAGRASAALLDPLPDIPKGSLAIGLSPVLTGMTSPMDFLPAGDGTGSMYAVDQAGVVTRVNPNGTSQVVLDVSSRLVSLMPGYDERGLLGFAVDPNFSSNHTVYTYTSEPPTGPADYALPPSSTAGVVDNHGVLAAWTVNPATGLVDVGSRRQILSLEHPYFNHNGGEIRFGADGMLYWGIGDGGNANDVGHGHIDGAHGNAQSTTTLMGKILRIDPHGTNGINGQYGTPADNPFAAGGGLPEIYAYGFRNPFSFSFDNRPGGTGQLIVGDVGQNNVEELDIVTKGANYGWHIKEGTFTFDPATGDVLANSPGSPSGLTDPVAEYDHDDGIAIVSGFVYRGAALPALDGMYIFGDLGQGFRTPSGRLFYTSLDPANPNYGVVQELILGSDDHPLDLFVKGIGQDQQGELYVLASSAIGPMGDSGEILKIVAVPEPASLALLAVAQRLSARKRRRVV